MTLRVIDEAGNNQDHDFASGPRIGERVVLLFRIGDEPLKTHYFRVKDIEFRLDNKPEHQIGILVSEETDPYIWPE